MNGNMRTVTVTVPYLGYSLAFTVDYEWHGKYVRATRESQAEYPELEIVSAVLMEIDGEVPSQQDIRLHGDAALIDRVELESAVIEADAREYPTPSREDAMNTDSRI